jgi:hypothetical protein
MDRDGERSVARRESARTADIPVARSLLVINSPPPATAADITTVKSLFVRSQTLSNVLACPEWAGGPMSDPFTSLGHETVCRTLGDLLPAPWSRRARVRQAQERTGDAPLRVRRIERVRLHVDLPIFGETRPSVGRSARACRRCVDRRGLR